MERDLRLTGSERGQSSNHVAPKGFDVSNPWKVYIRQHCESYNYRMVLTQCAGREARLLGSKSQCLLIMSSSVSRLPYIPSAIFLRNAAVSYHRNRFCSTYVLSETI